MLVAEKQLLDANLRNDLQLLRRLELKMMVSRYQTAIPAATLIVGFTFTSIVELQFIDPNNSKVTHAQVICERAFYVFAAIALSGSMYAMAVSSIAIMLGQRLAVQATANLTARHEANVKELGNKFMMVLLALLVSLGGVVGGSVAAIWVKAEGTISFIASCMIVALFPLVMWSVISMSYRLNDGLDEPGSLSLVTDGKHQRVNEFRVGDPNSIPVDMEAGPAVKPVNGMKPTSDERSALLKCAFAPAGKAQ